MPGLILALAATAAVLALGSLIFGGNDQGPRPRTRTQYPRPPPPPPSYPPRSKTTSAHIPAAPRNRTSTPPDYGQGRTPGQTQPSSTRLDELADLEDANKLREKARRHGRKMSEAYDQARIAQSMGDREVAQGHRQKADAYKSSMEEFDKRAAKIIFREKNKNRTEGEIDLHGLFVAEAVGFAKEVLRTARLRGVIVVRFIVGKGLHTVDGVAKIRPALEDLFTERGLDHSLDPRNAGVLIVRLV